MHSQQISEKEYMVSGKTYRVGKPIELDLDEQSELEDLKAQAEDLRQKQMTLLDDCFHTFTDFDVDLAGEFFEWERLNSSYNNRLSELLQAICGRLGGLLPLEVDFGDSPEAPCIRVRHRKPNEGKLLLDTAHIYRATGFLTLFHDMRMLAAGMAGTDLADLPIVANFADWSTEECPILRIDTEALKFSTEDFSGFAEFSWDEVQRTQIDAAFVRGMGSILTDVRVVEIAKSSPAMPMIAVLIGEVTTAFVNLSQIKNVSEARKVQKLMDVAAEVRPNAMILFQYGELSLANSKIDYRPTKPGVVKGFSAIYCLRGFDGLVAIGSRGWELVQRKVAPNNVSNELVICAVFENTAGLTDPKTDEILVRIMNSK